MLKGYVLSWVEKSPFIITEEADLDAAIDFGVT